MQGHRCAGLRPHPKLADKKTTGKPRFPKSLTKEFLLVDLINNVEQLAEAKDEVLKRVMQRAASIDRRRLRRAVRDMETKERRSSSIVC